MIPLELQNRRSCVPRPFPGLWPVLSLVLGLVQGNASAIERYGRYQGLTVRSLRFDGMKRTSATRLADLFDTRPGARFDPDTFAEDMRRLRNLELFQNIRVRFSPGRDGLGITVHVEDKWSLLPYFNFIRGGGSYEIVAGLFDVNVLGRLFTLDAMFILFDGKPAGSLYFTLPRIAGLPVTVTADGGLSRAIRTTYGTRGGIRRIYGITSEWGELRIQWEPVVWARVGLAYSFQHRTFEFMNGSPNKDVLPPGGRLSKATLLLSLGKLSYRNYFMHGIMLNVWLSTSRPWLGATETFSKVAWDARGYWNMGRHLGNLAGWLQGGILSGRSTFLDEFRLGSFTGLRGFRYAQFLGKNYVAAVGEYRSPLWATEFPIMGRIHRVFRGKSLLVQGVAFGAMGAVTGSENQTTPESGRLLSSVGAGARFIFLPFYRAILRIDAAVTLTPYVTWDIMVATQQAF